ncbi:unnamed protein product [Paramecium sonneborni]|uniref:Uncharacterized protein n=1 Tax=Paramecium sonneborni TaxID=65129 RepID=A0A8S1LHM6_9CILI|nr:unnamed protein product [Paramecium sonneborni]
MQHKNQQEQIGFLILEQRLKSNNIWYNFQYLYEISFDTLFEILWKSEDVSIKALYKKNASSYDKRNPITAKKSNEKFVKNINAAPQQYQGDRRDNIVPQNLGQKQQDKKMKMKNKYNKED